MCKFSKTIGNRNKLVLFVLLTFAFACSNNKKHIYGKWKFHSAEIIWDGDEKTADDALDLATISGDKFFNKFFGKLKFEFNHNNS